MIMFKNLSAYQQHGLLILRVGIGLMFMYHGYPKLLGGPDKWLMLGEKMEFVGIAFLPVFWGFMAAFAEFVGGLCFAIGWMFRPASALLAITMIVASAYHLGSGDGLGGSSHAIEAGILFISMLFIGPGKYSLDKG